MTAKLYKAAAGCALLVMMTACNPPSAYEPDVNDGDLARGRAAIIQYECGVCHVIPGIPFARGQVGPPLGKFRRHAYIAGEFPNTPEVLIAWLQNPPQLVPATAMPDVGVTAEEARDMAAFLYTLE